MSSSASDRSGLSIPQPGVPTQRCAVVAGPEREGVDKVIDVSVWRMNASRARGLNKAGKLTVMGSCKRKPTNTVLSETDASPETLVSGYFLLIRSLSSSYHSLSP